MLGNEIKKDLIINFVNNGQTGKCDGCVARRGATMADIDQVIYLTVAWNEKDWRQIGEQINKHVRESFCYGCSMDVFDNWRQAVREVYWKKHQEKVNNG